MAEALKSQGNAAFQSGDFERSIELFTAAIALAPSNHVLFSNRSGSHASLGHFNEALSDAETCITLQPGFAKGYSRKGLALFRLGRTAEAKQAYEQGIKVDPTNEQLKEGLKEVDKAEKEQVAPGLGKLFGPNIFAKLAANPKTAHMLNNPQTLAKIKMLQQYPNMLNTAFQDPDMIQVVSVLLGIDHVSPPPNDADFPQPGPKPSGGATVQEGSDSDEELPPVQSRAPEKPAATKTDSAPVKVLDEQEKKRLEIKKSAEATKNKGNDLYKQKKFDEAISLYNQAIELDPSNLNFVLNRAAANFEKKDFDAAIADCEHAIQKAQEHPGAETSQIVSKAYARLGNIYAKLQNLDKSIHSYNKSLVENNNYEVRQKLKEVENQKKAADEANYVDPAKSHESNELGKEAFKSGKFPEAIAHYTEAIKRNPTDAKLYANRAACYVKLMTWGSAMDDCDHCIKLDPTFVKAYIRKGKVQHCIKEYHKALSTFDEAAKLDPTNADLLEARRATQIAIAEANASGEVDPERQKRAMEDPEIQAILSDPLMNKILQDLQQNPRGNQAALKDPKVRANIEKLIAAGIIRTG